MSACPRPQSRRLLTRTTVLVHGHDHGHTWISDAAVLARADVFKYPPKPTDYEVTRGRPGVLPSHLLRRILGEARHDHRLGRLTTTGLRLDNPHLSGPASLTVGELLVVAPGALSTWGIARLHVSINPAVWEAWTATGLTPELTIRGHITWWGRVRNNRTLFGVVMPMALPVDPVLAP